MNRSTGPGAQDPVPGARPPRAAVPRVLSTASAPTVALAPALVLLAVIATWLASGLRSFSPAFLLGVIVAGATRLSLGRRGQSLVPRGLFLSLATVLGIASVIWLFGLRGGGRGATVVGMLCVVAAFQSLLLLGSLAGTRAYVIILLSSVHAVGTGFLRKDLEALLLVVAYVICLLWALLLFERRHSLERAPPRTQAIRRVRQIRKRPLPWRIGLRTLAGLVLVGFPVAILLIGVVPPISEVRTAYDFDRPGEQPEAGGAFDSRRAGSRWITGPPRDTSHVEYGSEAAIQESQVVFCEVREPGTGYPPHGIYLRDNVQDVYRANGDWDASPALMAADAGVLQPDPAGWFRPRHPAPVSGVVRMLEIRLHRSAYARWYLQPWALRWRLIRGLSPQRPRIDYRGNETLTLRAVPGQPQGFQSGDRIEQAFIQWSRTDPRLRGRRSDLGVTPLASYLDVPASTRRVVEPIARRLVGAVEDPWRRAQILEQALKQPPYAYTLAVVGFQGGDNMADFFEKSRRGHCGRYATALCMLLRTLGHPARYARGFWGGEAQETRPWTLFRFNHYHAWTEIYLAGVGWVALNPTPPDRRAEDQRVDAHALDTLSGDRERDAGLESAPDVPAALQFDRDAYDAFWRAVGDWLHALLVGPARTIFGPASGYIGIWLFLLLSGFSVWRRRRRILVARVAGAGGRVPAGIYGRTLLLLARKGFHRRRFQTPRELLALVARWVPAAGEPLEVLTRRFEAERYGAGRNLPPEAAHKHAFRALEHALAESAERPKRVPRRR